MSVSDINSSGHSYSKADAEAKATAVVDETSGVAVGNVLWLTSASKVSIYDANNEGNCASIAGICDGTYADTATASYFQNGDLVTGLSGLNPGQEYWADPATGQPGAYADIASGEWTRLLGIAASSSTLQLQLGEVRQK